MKNNRRCKSANGRRLFRFSLTTGLTLLTGLCVWLGASIERVKTQKRVVEAVQREGGIVMYDYQFDGRREDMDAEPDSPRWLRRLFGVDFFHDVTMLQLGDETSYAELFPESRPLLKEELYRIMALPELKRVVLDRQMTTQQIEAISRGTGIEEMDVLTSDGNDVTAQLLRRRQSDGELVVTQKFTAPVDFMDETGN
jgi:hypothetical protein